MYLILSKGKGTTARWKLTNIVRSCPVPTMGHTAIYLMIFNFNCPHRCGKSQPNMSLCMIALTCWTWEMPDPEFQKVYGMFPAIYPRYFTTWTANRIQIRKYYETFYLHRVCRKRSLKCIFLWTKKWQLHLGGTPHHRVHSEVRWQRGKSTSQACDTAEPEIRGPKALRLVCPTSI